MGVSIVILGYFPLYFWNNQRRVKFQQEQIEARFEDAVGNFQNLGAGGAVDKMLGFERIAAVFADLESRLPIGLYGQVVD